MQPDSHESSAPEGATSPEGRAAADAPAPQAAESAAAPVNAPGDKKRRRNRRRGKGGGRKQEAAAGGAAPADAAPAEPARPAKTPPSAASDDHKLQKLLAEAGLGSRRDMEEAITAGRVSVNGKIATLGQRITRRDVVRVDGKPIRLKSGREAPEVLIYHKPTGEIVTQDDPEGRPTVFDHLPPPIAGRWVAVGRLDFNTEGLLILTNSGELANRLMHPRYEVEREYSVRVVGELTDEQTDALLDGVELEDGPARFMKLDEGEFSDEGPGVNRWYRVMIREGRNREVRRMFDAVGVMVSRLIRTRFGPISLPRGLHRGQARPLTPLELKDLLKGVPGGAALRGEDGGKPGKTRPGGAAVRQGAPGGNGAAGKRKSRGKAGARRPGTPGNSIEPGQKAPAKRAGKRGKKPGVPGQPAKGPGNRRGGKQRGGIDRSALTLDGRRAARPRRRDEEVEPPPPPPMPVIRHRRSRLKSIPPENLPET